MRNAAIHALDVLIFAAQSEHSPGQAFIDLYDTSAAGNEGQVAILLEMKGSIFREVVQIAKEHEVTSYCMIFPVSLNRKTYLKCLSLSSLIIKREHDDVFEGFAMHLNCRVIDLSKNSNERADFLKRVVFHYSIRVGNAQNELFVVVGEVSREALACSVIDKDVVRPADL